ncbi:MAG: hypothetical protein LPK14_04460 [Hymenobacteraceae bacterium]|nr:hypothetical protein [Hymenobacteraceae bacterium]MDX5421483.1 hypothetical protein [Hymenobacteraceae bacterium]
MPERLQLLLLVLLPLLLVTWQQGLAQTRATYTSTNKVMITLDGVTQPYTYASDELLVRYNRNTQKLECIINVATLHPANDSVPPTMAYDVFFGAKYPDMLIEIDAPVQKINARNLYSETLSKKAAIGLQGVTNQTVIPVMFTPDRNTLLFSTSFDLMLDNFEATIPVKYYPLLTGRIVVTINNARWIGLETRQ